MSKSRAKRVVAQTEEDVVGEIFDAVLDVVVTMQLGWRSTPKVLQQELEDKIRAAINTRTSEALRVLLIRAQDRPTITADLESVKTKKGKTIATLNIPSVVGGDTSLAELSNQARAAASVLIVLADPDSYAGKGTSRAEEDQKPLFQNGDEQFDD